MTPALRSSFAALLVAAALLLGTTACSSDGGTTKAAAAGAVSVEDATVDWPANPSVAAVRMVVRNDTAQADTLVAVASPVATSATIHRTETDAAGRSTMTPQQRLPIPARSSVTFRPGGLHVMLTGITDDLAVGDTVKLTVTFEHAGPVTVTAKVIEPGTAGATGGSHDH